MSTGEAMRVVEHAWIEMSDGRRLAAKLWVPEVTSRNASSASGPAPGEAATEGR